MLRKWHYLRIKLFYTSKICSSLRKKLRQFHYFDEIQKVKRVYFSRIEHDFASEAFYLFLKKKKINKKSLLIKNVCLNRLAYS